MQQCNLYTVLSHTDGGRSHSQIGWRQTVGKEHDHFPMVLARVPAQALHMAPGCMQGPGESAVGGVGRLFTVEPIGPLDAALRRPRVTRFAGRRVDLIVS